MVPCFAIDDIKTPKGFLLRGLWFGSRKPKRVIIWVHGLGSSVFSKIALCQSLANKDTAILVFNNRGHDVVSRLSHETKDSLLAGAAHEKFTDCVDDIQGAINYARRLSVTELYLGGHSTGCQKSVYWAYKTGGKGIKGIILLAPVSDYAGALAKYGKAKVTKAALYARKMVARGRSDAMLPHTIWSEEPDDAQRFLSLYTPDSVEEIFTYVQLNKKPRILKSIKNPILVLWAEHDEFADRPATMAAKWFDENIKAKHHVYVIPSVKHSFKGAERKVAKLINQFISQP